MSVYSVEETIMAKVIKIFETVDTGSDELSLGIIHEIDAIAEAREEYP